MDQWHKTHKQQKKIIDKFDFIKIEVLWIKGHYQESKKK